VPVVHPTHVVPRASRRFASGGVRMSLAVLTFLGACERHVAVVRDATVDDFGDTVVVGRAPQRIASLNPAVTEVVYALGAGPRVVGRTSYDRIPTEVVAVSDLGPGLRPNVEAILATRPDLVILYASQDNRDAARRLKAARVATVSYKVDRFGDFARVTAALGRVLGDTAAARTTIDSVNRTLATTRAATAALPHPRVFWVLWEAPLLAAGGGSFLNDLLHVAGARNIYDSLPQPSPAVTFEDLIRRDPDVVLASATTRARMLGDPKWRTLRAVREGRVLVFDTTIVSGPSPRVGSSAVSLARLLHPDVTLR
jgi:ABC-type Fe3+-hydroxamate transport system substrate-binding protein